MVLSSITVSLLVGVARGVGDALVGFLGGYKKQCKTQIHCLETRTHESPSLLHHSHHTTLEKVEVRFMRIWALPHEGHLDRFCTTSELVNETSDPHIAVDESPLGLTRANI